MIHIAKNSNIMTEMMQKYGVSSGSYGGSTERTASPSDYFKERMDSVFGSEETRKSSVDSSFIDSFVKHRKTRTRGLPNVAAPGILLGIHQNAIQNHDKSMTE